VKKNRHRHHRRHHRRRHQRGLLKATFQVERGRRRKERDDFQKEMLE